MLAQSAAARHQTRLADAGGSPTPSSTVIGVGIDTSRYGHYAAFLNDQLQTAAPDLEFTESAQGYARLRQRLVYLVQKHGRVHFHIRLDVAGAYADNLLAWLQAVNAPRADAAPLAGATFSISCGDPQRNKNYLLGIYGAKKSPGDGRKPVPGVKRARGRASAQAWGSLTRTATPMAMGINAPIASLRAGSEASKMFFANRLSGNQDASKISSMAMNRRMMPPNTAPPPT